MRTHTHIRAAAAMLGGIRVARKCVSAVFGPRLLMLAALLLAGVALSSPAAGGRRAEAATSTVTITNFAFTDTASGTTTTAIHLGDTVMWNWSSGITPHSTCSGNACAPPSSPPNTLDPWSSGIFATPHSFSKTFTIGGTYTYLCEVHPVAMKGTIVVVAPLGGVDVGDDAALALAGPAAARTDGDGTSRVLSIALFASAAVLATGAGVWRLRRARTPSD